jgi:hypothetical protein
MNTQQNESLWLPIEQAVKDGRFYLVKWDIEEGKGADAVAYYLRPLLEAQK